MKFFILIFTLFILISCTVFKKSGDTMNTDLQDDFNYNFTEATKQYYLKNYPLALLMYNNYLKDNPESAAAHYQISNIFLNSGEVKKAEQYAAKAVELDKKNIWYKYHLAKIYSYQKDYQSALEIYSKLSSEEENVQIQFSAARLYAMNNKFKKALKILEEVEKNNGINEEMALLKHQIYKSMGKEKKAVSEIEKLLELDPTNENYFGVLGEYYHEIGKIELAKVYYEKLISINDENLNGLLSAADFYRITGNYEKADTFYRKALKINSDERVALQTLLTLVNDRNFINYEEQLVDEYFNIIDDYLTEVRLKTLKVDYYVKLEEYAKADTAIRELLKIDKKNPAVWDQYLFVLNFLEKDNELDSVADYIIDNFGNLPTAYLFKGLNLNKHEKHSQSVRYFEDGLKYAGDNKFLRLQFLTFLGESYNELKNYSKSDSVFNEALSIDPENFMILNNYSYYLSLREEKLDLAKDMSYKTVKHEPNNPTYLDTYAWILYKRGEIKEALKYIEKAYQNLKAKNEEILNHYIEILEKLGRDSEALIIKNELKILKD